MGLLDSPAVQKMIMEMLKQAAPDMAQHIDGFASLVKDVKDSLARIETRQIELEKRLIGENDNGGTSDGTCEDNRRAVGRIGKANPNVERATEDRS